MADVPPYEKIKNGSGRMPANMSQMLMNIIGSSPEFCPSNSTSPGAGDVAFRIFVDVCVVGLLCLIGFVGNTLTFVILRGDRDKNSTTNWLLNTKIR